MPKDVLKAHCKLEQVKCKQVTGLIPLQGQSEQVTGLLPLQGPSEQVTGLVSHVAVPRPIHAAAGAASQYRLLIQEEHCTADLQTDLQRSGER